MDKIKVKCGAIIEEIPKESLKWYKEAGWKVLEENKLSSNIEKKKNDKTNTKKIATT